MTDAPRVPASQVRPAACLQRIAQGGAMQGFTMRDCIRRIPEALVRLPNGKAGGGAP
jgi:hypothetical protein